MPPVRRSAAIAFLPIPQADAAKYQPEDKCYTKILVNGQEPDTRGVRSVNENGRGLGRGALHFGAAADGHPRCLPL